MWVRSPVYSIGDRTSIRGSLPRIVSTSSLKARISESSRSTTGYPVVCLDGTSSVVSRLLDTQRSRPPSSSRTSGWPNNVNTQSA